MTLENITPHLICFTCGQPLRFADSHLDCVACSTRYPVRNGAAVFIDEQDAAQPNIGDPLIQRIKGVLKRYERLYYFLVPIAGAPFVGKKKARSVFGGLPADRLILNVGSGPKILSPRIVNVDAEPFHGVLVAALASRLPFADATVDAIVCECLLEHATNPNEVMQEIVRVLKPGGLVYVTVPFMDPYHSSPDDYTRWTASGVREITQGLQEIELGIGWGPTSAMVSMMSHWFGILLSFGNRSMYQVVSLCTTIVLSPLKLLDYIFRYYPFATNSALGFYYLGKKPS